MKLAERTMKAEKFREDAIAIGLSNYLSDYNFKIKPSEVLAAIADKDGGNGENYLLWGDVAHLGERQIAWMIETLADQIVELIADTFKG